MKSFKYLTLAVSFFAAASSVHAKDFNPGSLEIDATSSGAVFQKFTGDGDGEEKILAISATMLYYPVRNLALGIDFTHFKDKYTDNFGNSSTYTSDTWSPVIAYNISLNESSGFLIGASKTGFLRGKSEYSESTSSTDISGTNLFAYFRHYINNNVGFSAGLLSEKTTYEQNSSFSSNSSETKSTALRLGLVIALPK